MTNPKTDTGGPDYSQLEARVLAYRKRVQGPNHEDLDLHTLDAAALFGIDPEKVTPEQRACIKYLRFRSTYSSQENQK